MDKVNLMRSRATCWHRLGARLAILGLLAHALLFAFHMPVLAWSTGSEDGLTRGVIICTAQGMKVVTVDDQGQPVESPAQGNAARFCPVCQVLSSAPMALPDASVAMLAPPPPTRLAAPDVIDPERRLPSDRPRNRGPPALA